MSICSVTSPQIGIKTASGERFKSRSAPRRISHRLKCALKQVITRRAAQFGLRPMLAALLTASLAFSQIQNSLKVGVDLVLLDVSIQDRDGRPVQNLAQNSFKIFEDR